MSISRRVLLASLPLLLTAPVLAAPPKTIVVGVENLAFQPHYGTEKGQYTGYFRDLMDAFAKEQGIKVVYKPMAIDDLFKAYFAGEVDFKYPDDAAWRSEARKGHTIYYSKPSVAYVDGSLRLTARKDITSAQIKTLGKPAGFVLQPYSSAVEAGLKVTEYASTKELLDALKAGKIDVAYHNIDVALYYARSVGENNIVFDPNLPMIQSDYRLSSNKYPEFLAKFDDFIEKEKNFCDKLRDKYSIDAARRVTKLKIFKNK